MDAAFQQFRSGKGWQFHEVVVRNGFKGMSGFAPGAQATGNHKRAKSLFVQEERHPGARGFALSSTVKIDVAIFREVLQFLRKIVLFNADRTLDAAGIRVVVAMTAHVDEQRQCFFG